MWEVVKQNKGRWVLVNSFAELDDALILVAKLRKKRNILQFLLSDIFKPTVYRIRQECDLDY
jgi:hypothetical protein